LRERNVEFLKEQPKGGGGGGLVWGVFKKVKCLFSGCPCVKNERLTLSNANELQENELGRSPNFQIFTIMG